MLPACSIPIACPLISDADRGKTKSCWNAVLLGSRSRPSRYLCLALLCEKSGDRRRRGTRDRTSPAESSLLVPRPYLWPRTDSREVLSDHRDTRPDEEPESAPFGNSQQRWPLPSCPPRAIPCEWQAPSLSPRRPPTLSDLPPTRPPGCGCRLRTYEGQRRPRHLQYPWAPRRQWWLSPGLHVSRSHRLTTMALTDEPGLTGCLNMQGLL